jgi:hypothetical protein
MYRPVDWAVFTDVSDTGNFLPVKMNALYFPKRTADVYLSKWYNIPVPEDLNLKKRTHFPEVCPEDVRRNTTKASLQCV